MRTIDKIARCQEQDRAGAFRRAVERGLRGLTCVSAGICPSCCECRDAHGITDEEDEDTGEVITTAEQQLAAYCERHGDEGGFSHHSCDCCGSGLGGNRYAAHGLMDDRQICHLDVCVDCLMYLANGDLPERWS